VDKYLSSLLDSLGQFDTEYGLMVSGNPKARCSSPDIACCHRALVLTGRGMASIPKIE